MTARHYPACTAAHKSSHQPYRESCCQADGSYRHKDDTDNKEDGHDLAEGTVFVSVSVSSGMKVCPSDSLQSKHFAPRQE